MPKGLLAFSKLFFDLLKQRGHVGLGDVPNQILIHSIVAVNKSISQSDDFSKIWNLFFPIQRRFGRLGQAIPR